MENKIQKDLEYIKEKWFIISDEYKIKWYLEKVWLHRLKKYFNTVAVYQGTDFHKIISAYVFDKRIRFLCLESLEIIEKSLKNMCVTYFWDYMNENLYINTGSQYNFEAEQKKAEWRIEYFEEKIQDLVSKDKESREYYDIHNTLSAEILYDNLSFWEILYVYEDLNIANQYIVSKYYGISNKLLLSWLPTLLILRNFSSHSRNIFNKKFLNTKWDFDPYFGKWSKSTFISRIFILDCFMKVLCPEFKFMDTLFAKMEKYEYNLSDFVNKKETSHIELKSEAWEVIVDPLYKKYISKSI